MEFTAVTKRTLRLIFTGFSMGIADLIPGVSGGTIAFLYGIYDELLYSIKVVTGDVPKLLLTGRIKEVFSLIPFGFLLPLVFGIGGAIFGLVHVVSYLLGTYPVLVWALFFGLVLGSTYVVSRRVPIWTLRRISLFIVGLILTYLVVGLPTLSGNDSLPAIFATGVIAITAMILPGISGSLIMAILGQYELVIQAVADLNLPILIVFSAGAITGLALFVRILGWLLERYHFEVIAFLVGVMAGSLRRVWPWQESAADGSFSNVLPITEWSTLIVLVLVALGCAIVFWLEKVGIAQEHEDIDTAEFRNVTGGAN